MCPLGDGEIHTNLASVQVHSIQSFTSSTGIGSRFEVEEGKSTAPPTVSVQNHLDLLEGSVLAELLLQLALRGVETEPEHPNALTGFRVVTVADMTASGGHG